MKRLMVKESGIDSLPFKTFLVDEKHVICVYVKGTTELDAEEKAIELKMAFNNTIGRGINPESVPDLLEVVKTIKEYWDSGNFSRKPEIWDKINSALEKSTIKGE